MLIRLLMALVSVLFSGAAFATHTLDVYIYNDTEGELIYPEFPVVLNQACLLGDNTIGPDYRVWERYAYIPPGSFADRATPFRISSPNFFGYPSLEHCHYVVSARPNDYYADFTLYHTAGEYCLKNSATAKKLYAYLTSTGDLRRTDAYIITIGITPIRETCMPD